MKRIALLASAAVLALGLAACGAHTLNEAERMTAELGAREIAERTGGKYLSCSGQDSDKDGYVTCSVTLTGASNSPPVELLCGYSANARGCKRKS